MDDLITIYDFFKRIQYKKDEYTKCWIVVQPKKNYITFRGVVYTLQRFSYIVFINPEIEKGMIIRRKCGNLKCVNPEHLILESRKDYASTVRSDWVEQKKREENERIEKRWRKFYGDDWRNYYLQNLIRLGHLI